MTIDFWRDRWESGQIGFHEGKPNELLVKHIHALHGAKRVLVPLSGKSKDLVFLAQHAGAVVGVEGVALACKQFADENPDVKNVELVCANFFDVKDEIGMFDAVYDRAALIAVDPPLRAKYVGVLKRHLQPGGRILLVSFVYDQSKIAGPPWSLGDEDVKDLFRDGFTVEKLDERPTTASPKLKDAGVVDIKEAVWLLKRP